MAICSRQYHRSRSLDQESFERYKALDLHADAFTSTAGNSLQEFYDRPWFSRVWCIQEIRLAQDAQVLWGQQDLPWSDVDLAASWIFDIYLFITY